MARHSDGTPRADDADSRDLLASFGANLRAARLKLGLTQAQLAEQSGLLQQYVSLVESGKQNVTLTTALSLATVVRQDLRNLLRRAKSPTPDKRV
jgi:transcriptional regulator with XRE-family HTH domain